MSIFLYAWHKEGYQTIHPFSVTIRKIGDGKYSSLLEHKETLIQTPYIKNKNMRFFTTGASNQPDYGWLKKKILKNPAFNIQKMLEQIKTKTKI